MLQSVTVLVLITPILCRDILLSVDEGKRTLRNQNCETDSGWALVEYENVGVSTLGSSKGLRASNGSCASHPIYLLPGYILCTVYVTAEYKTSGIIIALYSEDNELITYAAHKRSDESFKEGWREISLKIAKGEVGHINLLGYSKDNEMVLVDSIRYTGNITRVGAKTDKDLAIIDEEFNEVNLEKLVGKENSRMKETINNSNEEDPKAYSKVEPVKLLRNAEDSDGLGLWAIALIAGTCVVVAALVAVSAYHIGKLVANRNYPPPPPFDDHPASIEIIPRVRGTVDYFGNTVQDYI